MNFEKLDQLIAIPKKADASKAIKKQYKAEISKLLKEEGFSQNAEKYLWCGFSFCGAEPLFDFINSQAEEKQSNIVDNLLKCRTYDKNEKSNGFKMCLSLLAYELNYCPDQSEIIGKLIKGSIAKHKKKDGGISKDNIKIVEKYFILALASQAKLPNWNTIRVNISIAQEFCNYIIECCLAITGNKAKGKVEKVVAWLKSALPSAADDVTIKNSNIPSVAASESTANASGNQIMQKEVVETSLLFRISAQLKNLSVQLYSFAEESEKAKKTAAKLIKEKKEVAEALTASENTVLTLQNQLVKTEKELSVQKEQVAELLSEIEKLKTVISVYSEDKQSSMEGQLNAIASKLKTEYNEFKDALDLEMTAEIGEILRDQLIRIFKILTKAGINIESR